MSLHFNQQVLFYFSRGTLDISFLQNCKNKGYDFNQSLFDGDGNLNRDIFYFVTKSYYESVEELINTINFLLDNGFNFQTKYNYLYYFFKALARFQIISHPSSVSFICSFILKMQSYGLDIKYNSISYYYDPDLFEFLLINTYDKTSYTKLSISSIVFLIVTQLSLKNLYHKEDSFISENVVISKKRYNDETLKIEWVSFLKKLFPMYDLSRDVYIFKSLN